MKALWFLPLAFVAGEHGFAFFAPYLAVFLATVHLIKWRRLRPAAIPLTVKVRSGFVPDRLAAGES